MHTQRPWFGAAFSGTAYAQEKGEVVRRESFGVMVGDKIMESELEVGVRRVTETY